MKKKTLTTTEFYRNPSKALNFVLKDSGTVLLGYKGMKKPVAALINYDEYISKSLEKEKKYLYGKDLVKWLESRPRRGTKPVDTTAMIRKMRDEE